MEEMYNVRTAFQEFNGDIKSLIGYQKVDLHMIFDIKLSENFRRKSRLVAGGYRTRLL